MMDERKEPDRKQNPRSHPADDPLAADVNRALEASGRFQAGVLEVSTAGGVVKLQGRVATYYQKQVAQAAALAVIGPRQLLNEIEVQ